EEAGGRVDLPRAPRPHLEVDPPDREGRPERRPELRRLFQRADTAAFVDPARLSPGDAPRLGTTLDVGDRPGETGHALPGREHARAQTAADEQCRNSCPNDFQPRSAKSLVLPPAGETEDEQRTVPSRVDHAVGAALDENRLGAHSADPPDGEPAL